MDRRESPGAGTLANCGCPGGDDWSVIRSVVGAPDHADMKSESISSYGWCACDSSMVTIAAGIRKARLRRIAAGKFKPSAVGGSMNKRCVVRAALILMGLLVRSPVGAFASRIRDAPHSVPTELSGDLVVMREMRAPRVVLMHGTVLRCSPGHSLRLSAERIEVHGEVTIECSGATGMNATKPGLSWDEAGGSWIPGPRNWSVVNDHPRASEEYQDAKVYDGSRGYRGGPGASGGEVIIVARELEFKPGARVRIAARGGAGGSGGPGGAGNCKAIYQTEADRRNGTAARSFCGSPGPRGDDGARGRDGLVVVIAARVEGHVQVNAEGGQADLPSTVDDEGLAAFWRLAPTERVRFYGRLAAAIEPARTLETARRIVLLDIDAAISGRQLPRSMAKLAEFSRKAEEEARRQHAQSRAAAGGGEERYGPLEFNIETHGAPLSPRETEREMEFYLAQGVSIALGRDVTVTSLYRADSANHKNRGSIDVVAAETHEERVKQAVAIAKYFGPGYRVIVENVNKAEGTQFNDYVEVVADRNGGRRLSIDTTSKHKSGSSRNFHASGTHIHISALQGALLPSKLPLGSLVVTKSGIDSIADHPEVADPAQGPVGRSDPSPSPDSTAREHRDPPEHSRDPPGSNRERREPPQREPPQREPPQREPPQREPPQREPPQREPPDRFPPNRMP